MNTHEFKIWLEGFTEGHDVPTKEQWETIKEKLALTYDVPVVVPSNWPTYPSPYAPYYYPVTTYTACGESQTRTISWNGVTQ